MAIRIKTPNAIVEVDTPSEFSWVMREIGGLNGQKPHEEIPPSNIIRHKSGKGKLPQRNYSTFLKILPTRQKQALDVIGATPDGAMQDDLVQKLNLKSNFELAGIMGGGLARNAKRCGFNFDEIINRKPKVNSFGKRSYNYKLTNEMREAMQPKLV